MRIDERWLWLGPTLSLEEAGVQVQRAFRDQWWLTHGELVAGPFEDATILRASRVACTPTIDGCELGPHTLGIRSMSSTRTLRRGPRWQELGRAQLPASLTRYDRERLGPVSGCCTSFEAMPEVAWGPIDDWPSPLAPQPGRHGRLRASWNAHPAGSIVVAPGPTLAEALVIVDIPGEGD